MKFCNTLENNVILFDSVKLKLKEIRKTISETIYNPFSTGRREVQFPNRDHVNITMTIWSAMVHSNVHNSSAYRGISPHRPKKLVPQGTKTMLMAECDETTTLRRNSMQMTGLDYAVECISLVIPLGTSLIW